MDYNIFANNSINSGFEKLVEKLKFNLTTNKFQNHYFVVPDKISLNVEKTLFEKLNIDATFNIEVITLSRLVAKILAENTNTYNGVLSKQMSVMLVNMLLHKNKTQFNLFNSIIGHADFSAEIFDTISQLKSCKVLPNDFKEQIDNSLSTLKIDDIYLIYSKYENYLNQNNLIDSFDRLRISTDILEKQQSCEDNAFYFSHFISLTTEQIDFIKCLINKCGQLNFACVFPMKQNNNDIYPTELYNSLKSLFKEKTVVYTQEPPSDFSHVNSNIYATNPQIKDINCASISLFESPSVADEINNIAKIIKHKVVFGQEYYKNSAIMCANFEQYSPIIKNIFEKFEVPVFLDKGIDLAQHFYSKYILNIIKIIVDNFDQSNMLNYIKSEFCDLPLKDKDAFENIVLKYGIDNNQFKNINFSSLLENGELFDNEILELLNIQKFFKQNKMTSDRISALKQFLELKKVIEVLKCKTIDYHNDNNFMWQKFTEEVFKNVEKVFNDMQNSCDVELSLTEFYEILESGFKGSNLSLVPNSTDCVFVGDICSSMIMPVEHLFVVGANYNDLPNVKKDCGILIDKELNNIDKNNKVEPTIRQINKRTKFFTIQQLLNAKQTLTLSYATVGESGTNQPSLFIKYLQNMFTVNGKKLPIIKTLFIDSIYGNKKEEQEYFALNFLNGNSAENYLLKNNLLMDEKFKNIKQIFSIADNDSCAEDLNLKLTPDENYKLFFKKGGVSPSQLECFYDCPYKNFVRYGLRAQDRELFEIKPTEIGNVLHGIAKLFIENYKGDELSDEKLRELSDNYFSQSNLKLINLQDNNAQQFKSLKDEAYRLIKHLYYERQCSTYKNYAVEKPFDISNYFGNLNFNGVVDRIDVCENDYRIIDYKTISNDKSNGVDLSLKKIFKGQKLQLLLYADAVGKLLKKELTGVFYFPIRNGFAIDNEDNTKSLLSGYYVDDINKLKQMDKNIENSDKIIDAKINVDKIKSKKAISQQELKDFCDYAIIISTNAVKEMLNGFIMPLPQRESETKNSCIYCDYSTICGYSVSEKGYRTMAFKVEKENISSAVKNEE